MSMPFTTVHFAVPEVLRCRIVFHRGQVPSLLVQMNMTAPWLLALLRFGIELKHTKADAFDFDRVVLVELVAPRQAFIRHHQSGQG